MKTIIVNDVDGRFRDFGIDQLHEEFDRVGVMYHARNGRNRTN